MSTEGYRIVFEDEDGYPRELTNAGDRRRAIETGALRPDTMVTLYRDGASPIAVEAIDIPELGIIFHPAAPVERAESPPPAPAPPPPPQPPFAQTLASPAQVMEEQCAEMSAADDEASNEPLDPASGYRRGPWPPLIAAAIVIASLFWIITAMSNRPAPTRAPLARTYTALVDVNARAAPARTAEIKGVVHQGEIISGELKSSGSGQMWLEVQSGPYAGSYIWSGNLAALPPPSSAK